MAGQSFDPATTLPGPGEGQVEYRNCTCPAHEGDTALPATSEFFRVRIKRGHRNVDAWCKRCRRRYEREQQRSLVREAKKLIANVALKKGRRTPHFDDLLDEVYRRVGGMKRVAREIAQFIKDDTPQGRVTKRSTVMKVFEATQSRTTSIEEAEAKQLNTAAIRAELHQLLKLSGLKLSDLDEDEDEEDPLAIIDERHDEPPDEGEDDEDDEDDDAD